MEAYSQYSEQLDTLINSKINENSKLVETHLNGGADEALHLFVNGSNIKDSGAYFTNRFLGIKAIENIDETTILKGVFDPSCGAGDLLLRWAERLPVFKGLEETVSFWGTQLGGVDIHPQFIEVAKKRLVLCALQRGVLNDLKKLDLEMIFPNIRVGSFYDTHDLSNYGTIFMNPPFTQIAPAKPITWSTGKISQAALFVDHFIKISIEGQNILAILPDVIRSGSRYRKFRSIINDNIQSKEITILGRFNKRADIDVFLLNGLKVNETTSNNIPFKHYSVKHSTIGNVCDVRVGTVVPHRDKEEGLLVKYFTARDIPLNESAEHTVYRKVSSTVFSSPLISLKRTSSPSDKNRIVASIIKEKSDVALENHLIAILPKKKTLKSCQAILDILQKKETINFINQEIRCRHLTVSAIKNIPLPSNFEL